MKPGATHEGRLLQEALRALQAASDGAGPGKAEMRTQLLEAVASRFGGFDLAEFHAGQGITPVTSAAFVLNASRRVVEAVERTGIPPALAMSALAREELDEADQRRSGAYHTDFRLALHLASSVDGALRPGAQVIDPACGAGILLAAVSVAACGRDRVLANEWLRHSVHAADLSPAALRGTLLSLACLTSDVPALMAMRARWREGDSLLLPADAWRAVAPNGFDVVVANPPWEKVKLSRHEYARSRGDSRHYGASYGAESLLGYDEAREDRAAWTARLVERYPTLAAGEPDLYVAFTELLVSLLRPGGCGAVLVPAGLIRSKGTEVLRRLLVERSRSLSIVVLDNRAKHFAIDTRFKFLSARFEAARPGTRPLAAISLSHGRSMPDSVETSSAVRLPLRELTALRPDLTLPEVRTDDEWRLFSRMQTRGADPTDPRSPWHPEFCREVDMTREKPKFDRRAGDGRLPVVEGRMVQPHRLGAKTYVSGEGRRARWDHLPPGASRVSPQFWILPARMPTEARMRACRERVGFCDIVGQTNERTMMASLVPTGVVCGNKVPSVLFPNDPTRERLLLWLAVVNSLPFDWLVRRVVTTTINYFVLLSVRLPDLAIDGLPARRLVEIASRLAELDGVGAPSQGLLWRIAELRAETDALVATAYGCTDADVRLMLRDFPLLDRGQPAIRGEAASTVTRDLLVATLARRRAKPVPEEAMRVHEARQAGAVAYVPSEFVVEEESPEVADA